ncbi:MAG: DegV family protein [Clostridiaceae bacterium]|nr:DegV family protein [Clostridiaceae bacterium]
MDKIAFIGDTTGDLSSDIIAKYNINILSFRIIYKDREYLDRVNITPTEVYDNMVNEIPTSSMPSMQDIEDMFLKLISEGYTHIIAVTLSTGLSGIFNGIRVVSENHPEIKTYICDSKSISIGEGAILIECGKLRDQGKNFNEIVAEIPNIMKRIHLFFVVPTLEYLKKGGRIGKVAGTIAELLDIKPIITVDQEGKYTTFAKVRGRKQSLAKLVDIARELLKQKKYTVYLANGAAREDVERIYNAISKLPNLLSINMIGDISPVSGVHSGPGLIGLVMVEE